MNGMKRTTWAAGATVALLVLLSWHAPTAVEPVSSMIVQGESLHAALEAVQDAGGVVTQELGIISAVGARLTADQVEALRADDSIRRSTLR